MTNLRVAMFLELATTAGACRGAYLAQILDGRWLFMALSSGSFLRILGTRDASSPEGASGGAGETSTLADRLGLHSSYFDQSLGREVPYRVAHLPLGFGLMYIAGMVSGLLGIGSGSLKVPAMDLAMRLPIKVSTATSNFMIGVTAAASAGVYFSRGKIDPFIAAPVAAGVLAGAILGSRLLGRLNNQFIRVVFVIVLLAVSGQMLWKGFHLQ